MRRLQAIVFGLGLVLAASLAMARTPNLAAEWNGAEINWRDVKTGIYESSKTNKPVIMVFHASWCGYCKKYRAVFKDPGVVEASKDFVMILVDADTDRSTNGAFSPDGTYVPRTIFIDALGEVLTKYHGNTDPEHPHTIDISNPAELRALMNKARSELSSGSAPSVIPENKT